LLPALGVATEAVKAAVIVEAEGSGVAFRLADRTSTVAFGPVLSPFPILESEFAKNDVERKSS